jgi:hypothetical protein
MIIEIGKASVETKGPIGSPVFDFEKNQPSPLPND